MESGVKINCKFAPLFAGQFETRYYLFTGGRAASKSHSIATWLGDVLRRYDNWRALFTRYTMVSAEMSIIPEFADKLDLLQIRDQFQITKNWVTNNATGSDVIFSGVKTSSGNQTAKLKSIANVNIFIIEEGEEFDSETDFDKINESIRRADVPNIIIIIMNPSNSEHWIYKRWIENSHQMINIDGFQIPISTHPDVTHVHTTFMEAMEFLSDSYKMQIKRLRENDREKYGFRFIGVWRDHSEGVIFENWKEGNFDKTLAYCYGLDFGFTSPLALVKIAVDSKRRLIFIDEYLYKSYLPAQNVIHLMGCIDRPYDLIIADSAEPTLIAGIAQDGYNITNAKKREIIEDIRLIQEFQIIVTERSYNVKRELRNYAWNDKKSETPVDDWNHALDAMRYAFNRLYLTSTVLATN